MRDERGHRARAGAGGQDVVVGDVESELHVLVLLRLDAHLLLVALRRAQLTRRRAARAEQRVLDVHLRRLVGLHARHLEAVVHQVVERLSHGMKVEFK